ncbi:septation protein SepH [Hamadaea tsunoensis]|uniref:septation protein SepH n=1 Tax=Hamadaea tsunoensis TaxID=53368 RepID=UPI000418241B|nr:septation protein SepH [Hamadaea tsunoensis]
MRPVRFVALSEDGQALVLADEVGRLLALPIDDRVSSALQPSSPDGQTATLTVPAGQMDGYAALSPRDIQARIRGGESADDVARVAGVPVDRVLRYAGPVLQERAMLAQHARRTRLKTADRGTNGSLAEIVDARLAQHGIDSEKISWDAYRREDGTWRVIATWPSGKATAQAIWELDKTRQSVTPHDDMAQYLCADRTSGAAETVPSRGETSRGGHGLPAVTGDQRRPSRDPIRAGRDALVSALDRPLGGRGLDTPGETPRRAVAVAGGAASLIGGQGTAFDDESDAPKEVPAVPSLAVLRPRRASAAAEGTTEKPRKRLPSWDDVLFGGAPAARESS